MKHRKELKGFFIDTKENREITINPTLDSYYELIGCNTIDIVTRRIGDKLFDIVCDDEALLYDDLEFSAVDKNGAVMLCGNLLILGLADEKGYETSLSDDDIALIKQNINSHKMLICEYE